MMSGKKTSRLPLNSGNGFMKIRQDIGRLSQICIGKNWKHLKPHGTFWYQSNPIKQLLLLYASKEPVRNHARILQQFLEASLGQS